MGMFIRFLMLVLIAALVWRMIKSWLQKRSQASDSAVSRPISRPKSAQSVEDMVSCQVCGLHLPSSQATQKSHHYYCAEHA